MRTASALALVAVGAIFAFAINRSPSFLNLQVVGWVLMVTGIAGALIPRRGSGWTRRRVLWTSDDEAVAQADAEAVAETADAGAAEPGTETAPIAAATEVPRRRRVRVPRPRRLVTPRPPIVSALGVVEPIGSVERETLEEYIEE
jgi:hypothetical protein